MKLQIQSQILGGAAKACARSIVQVVILFVLLLLEAGSSQAAADNNPLLGDWELVSPDANPTNTVPQPVVRIHFRKDTETDEIRAASKFDKDHTQTTEIRYLIVPSDPVVTVMPKNNGTAWVRFTVLDANHIQIHSPGEEIYQRMK